MWSQPRSPNGQTMARRRSPNAIIFADAVEPSAPKLSALEMAADATPIKYPQGRKPCCTEFLDTLYGSEEDCDVKSTYAGGVKEEDRFDQPECIVTCCGRKRSCVLILNNAAAMLHGVIFTVLLVVVLTNDVQLSRPLTTQITIWQNTTGRNASADVCKHSPRCAMPSPKIEINTTNDGTFDIFTTEIEQGSLDMVWLVLSFSFLSFLFQMFRPFVNSVERNLRPCISTVFCGCCSYGDGETATPATDGEIVSSYMRDIMAGVNSTRFVEVRRKVCDFYLVDTHSPILTCF